MDGPHGNRPGGSNGKTMTRLNGLNDDERRTDTSSMTTGLKQRQTSKNADLNKVTMELVVNETSDMPNMNEVRSKNANVDN